MAHPNNLPKKQQKAPLVFINEAIKAQHILLIDEDGTNLWTFDRYKALKRAEEEWLDLIQVYFNMQTNTSTCVIQDRWRYQYAKKKQESLKKKNQAKGMKEIDFWYTITDNDLQLKIEKALSLLDEWYTVKFVMKLRWRQMAFKSKAFERVNAVVEKMNELARSQWIKEEAKWYSVILAPKSK